MNPLQNLTLGFFNFDSPVALIIVALILLLVFGKRLPEVGRSLGKGIIEFKKGLAGVEEDVTRAGTNQAAQAPPPPQVQQAQSTPPAQLAQQGTPTPTATPMSGAHQPADHAKTNA